MSVCPNCGKEIEADAEYCEQCGNPLGGGRPWDKDSKPSQETYIPDRGPKVKHQEAKSSKRTRYQSVQAQEWYLKDEFVIHVGYCGFTGNPEHPEELREGTAILTKNVLIFGSSEHSIRCGKYAIEIPVELIEYVTDSVYKGQPAFLIHISTGEDLIMYVRKKSDWTEYFGYVTEYRPLPEDTLKEPEAKPSFWDRWGKAILYLIGAVFCFLWSTTRTDLLKYVLIFISVCFVLLVLIAIFAPQKLKR